MVTIDLSDFTRFAAEYRQRAAAIQSDPWGAGRREIHSAIRDQFRDALMEHEGVHMKMQHGRWIDQFTGYYGGGHVGHDLKKINPQEWIGRSGGVTMGMIRAKYASHGVKITAGDDGIHGSGRFFESSAVQENVSGQGVTFDLTTQARMQPYPDLRKGYFAPEKPIMYYFRHGWKNPSNPNHQMKPRPFGSWLASRSVGIISRFGNALLRAAGFRER